MRVLVIDLNNFSRYPTLSIGYLVAILRESGFSVDVLSPFAKGIHGYPRVTQASPWDVYYNFVKHWSAVTPNRIIRKLRKQIREFSSPGGREQKKIIVQYTKELLENNPDVVLISAYTMHASICHDIGRLCSTKKVPVIVGGSYFVEPEIAAIWKSIPGVSAVYAGEPESDLSKIVSDLVNGKDISHYPGVLVQENKSRPPAPPLLRLDNVPFPDYSDFPWSSYPNRIIPMMTGRGCGWGHCKFCSDVVTSSGRTFRSRSIDNVMEEITFQVSRFNTDLFVFLDLKLNSDLQLWRGLISRFPETVPDAKWTASVHVDNRSDNGLSKKDLQRARKAGLVRITCGIETGSEKVQKLMAKGTRVKRLSQFLKDAYAADLSVRMTSIIGYPGEEPADVDLTAQFIEEHSDYIERIILNRFVLMPGTGIDTRIKNHADKFPLIRRSKLDTHTAVVPHENRIFQTKEYYAAVFRLMRAIHKINRRSLRMSAMAFEGVM